MELSLRSKWKELVSRLALPGRQLFNGTCLLLLVQKPSRYPILAFVEEREATLQEAPEMFLQLDC